MPWWGWLIIALLASGCITFAGLLLWCLIQLAKSFDW